jgi:hypothetical protein
MLDSSAPQRAASMAYGRGLMLLSARSEHALAIFFNSEHLDDS